MGLVLIGIWIVVEKGKVEKKEREVIGGGE